MELKKNRSLLVSFFLLAFGLLGMGALGFFLSFGRLSEGEEAAADKFYVLSTTTLINDLVRELAKETVRAESLMGPGIDPHLYQARESDVGRLASADLIFYNGLALESKLGTVLEKMRQQKPTVALAEGIDKAKLLAVPEVASAFDPHFWFDATLWKQAAALVAAQLSRQLPQHRSFYQKNLTAYSKQLEAMHQEFKLALSEVPPERRVLVSVHDAFSYFARAYNFKNYALQGVNTAAQPGVKQLQRLVALIVENKIPVIFMEASTPRRSVLALQAAAAARGFSTAIGGTLFTDALGGAAEAAGGDFPVNTYLGMMRHNVALILKLKD